MPKLKALPKAIIIAVVIGGIGFGAYKAGLLPKKSTTTTPVEQPAPEQTQAPAPVAQPQTVPDTPATAPSEPADSGGLQPADGHDAGMNAVLKAGKK